jgi:hypothetical protein
MCPGAIHVTIFTHGRLYSFGFIGGGLLSARKLCQALLGLAGTKVTSRRLPRKHRAGGSSVTVQSLHAATEIRS